MLTFVAHCYNADERIIKVSKKFENDMRCECVYCSIGACYSSSYVHKYEKKPSEWYEMGVKSFVLCC